MGFGVTELLILLLIVALLFGTKKLRNMGGDLGSAVKSFRSAVSDKEEMDNAADKPSEDKIIEGQVESADEETEKN